MTLALAILHILDTCPRPVAVEIIVTFLPAFYDGPDFAAADTAEAKSRLVTAQLETLAAVDEVVAIADHHAGRLWKITANGKAAL